MTAAANRYAVLEAHADAGLGADEVGTRRFTRQVDRIDLRPVDSRVPMGNSSGMDLGAMFDAIDEGRRADLEAEITEGWRAWEAMPDSADRDALRDRLWALEDRADAVTGSRADQPEQENGPGSAATDSEANVSTPTKRKN